MWWTASVVVNISGFLLDAVPARSLKCPSLETELQPIGTRFSLPLQGPPKNMLLSNASSYESFGNVGLWFKKGRQTDHDDANCKEDDVVDLVDCDGLVVFVPALNDVEDGQTYDSCEKQPEAQQQTLVCPMVFGYAVVAMHTKETSSLRYCLLSWNRNLLGHQ